MSKINLIIQREYLTRVKKKSFLIMTFLAPVLFATIMAVPIWLSNTMKDETQKVVAVVDNTQLYDGVFKDKDNLIFEQVDTDFETTRNDFKKNNYFAVLHITEDLLISPDKISLYSDKQVGMEVKTTIARQMEKHLERVKKSTYNIENLDEILKSLETDISINAVKWGKDGKARKSSVEIVMAIGMVSAFLIYMFIFIYGAQVMRGVIEEKTSRIVEVIVSSVKPFQLMMGKVIGIALVGLTQFLLWVGLTAAIFFGVQATFLSDMDLSKSPQQELVQGMGMENANPIPAKVVNNEMAQILQSLQSINFTELIIFFLIYFLGGYLLYAALFAAIGAAVDNETDTQQFMIPVTIPMVFAIYVAMSAIQNPHGPLTFWCSLIPFTSPIVMMVRIPYDVPMWEKLLSVAILILTFMGTIWLAAKIYRTGILMYGKKVSYKELFKWIKYRN